MKSIIKAKFNKNGNIKLGRRMWSFSKLYGNWAHESARYGAVMGSCGSYCDGCSKSCYVRKSYRYPSVIDSHARNTLAFRNDLQGAFNDLNKQIDRAKNKPAYIRIDQSGEIESPMELLLWVLTAKKHPNTAFYTYTKNFDAVRMVINTFDNGASIPSNITINISVWHEYGMDAFEEFKKYPFIKAFVYDDGFDYAAHGLNIETYCRAYDEAGKMDHNVTCELCRKCIDRPAKVIGCFDH